MLYKNEILTLVTMVYSWYGYEYFFMGPSGRFYSFIYLLILMIATGRSWLEFLVQGRQCPISVSRVGLPDTHEYSAG